MLTIHRLRLCLTESRPAVQLIVLARFAAGAALAGAGVRSAPRLALGAAAWALATISIYVFNGLMDRPEDVANGSRRPLARGDLPVRTATAVTVGGALGAVAGALCAGFWPTVIMAGYLAVGYAYSGRPFPLKRHCAGASLAVMLMGAATYTFGALAAGGRPNAALFPFALAMALWMGAVGGVAKDLSDVAGDRAAGRRTWPLALGETRTRVLICCASCAIAAGLLCAALAAGPVLTGPGAALALGAVATCLACAHAPAAASRARRRLPYRSFMWTQYACHAALAGSCISVLH
jgi:4-hydroxybenzoate polyprenyltransferase